MTSYNPRFHHRRSIRLKGYDYAKEGLYFITICCKNMKRLFGEIENGIMKLNDMGEIAQKCWLEIPEHFPNVVLHEYVVMPNHVHGIIELLGAEHFPPQPIPRRPFRSPSKTVGSVVRGFKIGVTKWVRQNTDVYEVWQRNYYEHIIRNEQANDRIAEYILNNPAKWQADKFNKK